MEAPAADGSELGTGTCQDLLAPFRLIRAAQSDFDQAMSSSRWRFSVIQC